MDFSLFVDFAERCGDFLGRISTISCLGWVDAVQYLLDFNQNFDLSYVNLFTGETLNFYENVVAIPNSNKLYSFLVDNFSTLIPASTPLWLFICEVFFSVGFGLVVLKWFLDIIL